MSVPENKAVFLSYAREDSAGARKIAEALRAVGVEVWFTRVPHAVLGFEFGVWGSADPQSAIRDPQ